MVFDHVIKRPSHDKIRLSDGTTVYVDPLNTERLRISVPVGRAGLDQNDVIRLAAFLNRNFRENHQDLVREEAARVKASRAAKQARYEARKAAEAEVSDGA